MPNIYEYKDRVAFHPGFYIKELVDESGLTQEDYAKRLDTTPKNLSLLIRGEQSLSTDIALKLSRMLGTSVQYWLNLQSTYDSLIAEFNSDKELKRERIILESIDYKYFVDNFGLPKLPRKIDEQIIELRRFLQVSTLSVFKDKDMTVSFRSSSSKMNESNIIKANMMVQIAINEVLNVEAPRFNKDSFNQTIDYVLSLTNKNKDFYALIKDALQESGVLFTVLPNLSGSKINGATKKIGNHIMLMVNDRRLYTDTFWFTLFHEFGHIMNGDYGISFEDDDSSNDKEKAADRFAEDKLIPPSEYESFIKEKIFTLSSIRDFAESINRNPGIVLGRLQHDGLVKYDNHQLKELKNKYIINCI